MLDTVERPAAGDDAAAYEFDPSFQLKIATLMLRDSHFAMRAKDLVRPEYFTEDAVGSVIRMAVDFTNTHKSAPAKDILPTLLRDEIAKKRIREDMKDAVKDVIRHAISPKTDLSSSSFVMEKIVDFARHQAIEQAILQSAELLAKGDFTQIEKLQRQALAVGSVDEAVEYDYFEEIEARTKHREDWKAGRLVFTGITTGYVEIDNYLYHHGWGRQELSLIMGAAKAGKTLSLGEFTKNASLAGFNTAYLSCEVACRIVADRLDANISDTAMRLLKDDPAKIRSRIRAAQKDAGALKMRAYPTGMLKPSQINRLIENYRAEGIILDLVTVDYADIMAAEYRSDNLIDNMRAIYIDLRAIAHSQNVAMLTATQTNREGAKKSTAKATDVAEDFNKIRTADIVLGINVTDEEKIAGEARLTWVASRNTEDGFTLRIKQDREKLKFLTRVLGRE